MSLTQVDRSENSVTANGNALSLRAATPADRAFLRGVFISTRQAEFAGSGLSAQQVDTLLAEQFDLQDSYYRRHYPAARFDVLMKADKAVGRLYHHWDSHELRIIDIALLPAYRGAGIGAFIMRALIAQAAQRSLAATLYVEAGNPVKSLYQRLGFVKRGENGIYEQWQRAAGPFDSATVQLTGL